MCGNVVDYCVSFWPFSFRLLLSVLRIMVSDYPFVILFLYKEFRVKLYKYVQMSVQYMNGDLSRLGGFYHYQNTWCHSIFALIRINQAYVVLLLCVYCLCFVSQSLFNSIKFWDLGILCISICLIWHWIRSSMIKWLIQGSKF